MFVDYLKLMYRTFCLRHELDTPQNASQRFIHCNSTLGYSYSGSLVDTITFIGGHYYFLRQILLLTSRQPSVFSVPLTTPPTRAGNSAWKRQATFVRQNKDHEPLPPRFRSSLPYTYVRMMYVRRTNVVCKYVY